jgi:hypothetical protein
VIPDGTLNVPDEVNDSIPEGISVILNDLVLVLEATSFALTVKVVVVKDATSVDNVPEIVRMPAETEEVNPAGSEPIISYPTAPADSGSVASIVIVE